MSPIASSHTNPAVSVVIPAYGVTEYIAATLDSVFSQTFQDFEVIVVNDCCPDTEALERALTPYYSRIKYLKHDQNTGPGGTRNTGIQAAAAGLVAFLDGDDMWDPRYLEVQTKKLDEHPEAALVYSDGFYFGATENLNQRFMDACPSEGEVTLTSLFGQQVTVFTSTALSRKQALLDVGMLDTTIRGTEDFDLWVRIVGAGGKIIYHHEPLVHYRQRAGSLSSNAIAMYKSALTVAYKTQRTMKLTTEELAAIEDAINRWTAKMKLEQGKLLFARGASRAAAAHVQEANLYLKRPKLRITGFLMRWAPGVVRLLRRNAA